jgi:hypothetical protein
MCILKIYSETKSFQDYTKSTTLPVVSCHVKGQIRRTTTGELHKAHRISFSVSDKDWGDFKGQVAEAIAFLDENELELAKLIDSHKGIDAYLDFPLYSRLNGEIVNQNDHLPRDLIVLAGRLGLGIEMAIYEKDAFDEVEV